MLALRPIFELRAILIKCTKWPQNGLQHYKVKDIPYIYYKSPRVPNFNPCHSTANCFRVACHIEATAQNDPRMILNTTRSKVPHICSTDTPKSKFSLSFALRGEMFKMFEFFFIFSPFPTTLGPNLKNKCPEWTQNEEIHTCDTSTPESQISILFILWSPCFELQVILRKSTPNDSKMTLNTTRSKVPQTCHANTPPNFNLCLSTASRYRVIVHLEETAANDPTITLNTTTSKISNKKDRWDSGKPRRQQIPSYNI